MFSLGKTELWTHWEFCAYHRILGIRLWIFISTIWCFTQADNMWNESTSSIQVYIQQWFLLSCWRFLLCQLSHRYVMRMYCPSITILGYTSQRRNFEKFINIHLNKKTLRRSSITHFQKQPPEVFYKSCS